MQRVKSKIKKIIGSRLIKALLTAAVIFLIIGYFFLISPGTKLMSDSQRTIMLAKQLKQAVRDQNLAEMESTNNELQNSLSILQEDISQFRYLNLLPYVKFYYQDAKHLLNAGIYGTQATQIIIDGLKPLASLLGLEEESEEISAQEKVAQLARITPDLIPFVAQAQEKLNQALEELNRLHPNIYPEKIKGFEIRNELTNLKATLPQIQEDISDFKPFLEEIPSLLGVNKPKRYLILFQNDKELRPTGGFITAYAIAELDNGYFTIITSDDIYNLDQNVSYLTAPQPIIWHLKVSGFFLRDTNFSPDFKKSMKDLEYYYERIGTTPIDGIFAIDTQFVEHFLELSGPITVPGYSLDFSDYWNLPESCQVGGTNFTSDNVVCRLELYAQRVYQQVAGRKEILGELMAQIVGWALNAPSDKWPELVSLIINQFQEKHLLLYLHNQTAQSLAEKYNWAGRIKDFEGDYLHVNQANLAGLKSDMYLKRQVKQEISVTDNGEVNTKLTLTIQNTGKYDGWLNSTARNYIRVYVPKGSELLSWSGGEYARPNVFEELGKTVFDNFVLTKPLSQSELIFEYRLPFKFSPGNGFKTNEYKLLIQKQPGLDGPKYEVEFESQSEQFELRTDRELRFNL